jgi:hypothetical protein
MVSAQESGIGGFLLLFALTQILSLGLMAWTIPRMLNEIIGSHAPIVQRMWSGYLPLVIAELVFVIARGVGARFSDSVHAYLLQRGKSSTQFDAAIDSGRMDNFRLIAYAVIWSLYWRSSERVRLTFTPGPGMTEIPTQS